VTDSDLPGAAVAVALPGPLREGRFLARPNRFLLRCALAAEGEVEAHLADPGRLRELLLPGRRVWLREAAGQRPASARPRRTRFSAVLVETPDGGGLVSVDTTLPNRLIHRALLASALPELDGWTLERREARIGRSRIDFLLRGTGEAADRRLALEVKSVTLVEDRVALFPDAITARGARHVRELAGLAATEGWEAAVLFVVQRPDVDRVLAAPHIDAAFAAALADARTAGVRVFGRRCRVDLARLTLAEALPAE
jgi:sugar fermentation stimulation protein A